jgi:hypothetical protein
MFTGNALRRLQRQFGLWKEEQVIDISRLKRIEAAQVYKGTDNHGMNAD